MQNSKVGAPSWTFFSASSLTDLHDSIRLLLALAAATAEGDDDDENDPDDEA